MVGGGQEGLKREGGDAGLVRRCQLARSHTDARCQHVPSRRERRSATACARPAGSAPEPVAARRQRKESLVTVLRPRRPGPHAACAARGAARRVAGGTGLRCHGGRVSAPRRSAGQADSGPALPPDRPRGTSAGAAGPPSRRSCSDGPPTRTDAGPRDQRHQTSEEQAGCCWQAT